MDDIVNMKFVKIMALHTEIIQAALDLVLHLFKLFLNF